MRCLNRLLSSVACGLVLVSSVYADGVLTPVAGGGSGLPSGGTVDYCILNTGPGVGSWQPCPGAAGGDSVSVNGSAVADPNFATSGSDLTLTNTANVITFTLKSGLTITSPTLVTPALGTPASGVGTNLTGIPFTGLTGSATDAQIPNTITIDLATAATALASNPTDCGANEFATTIAASGNLGCAALTDDDVPDALTASNYLPLAGGTLTGQLTTDNLGIEFTESDTNPTCAGGNYTIFVDLSETVFKKCVNGSVSLLDTGGGGGSAAGGANAVQGSDGAGTFIDTGCTAASGVMTCAEFTSGSAGPGKIGVLEGTAPGAHATTGYHNIYIDSADSLLKSHENGGSVVTYHSTANLPAALAVNGANCSSGQFPLGMSAAGASENCTALPTTIAGTANEIAASASTGAITLSIPPTLDLSSKTVRVPNSTTLPVTCTVGDLYDDTNATTGLRLYLCEATDSWVAQGSGGGSGLTSLASQTGGTQTITRGIGIAGSSSADDHAFTFDATELTNLTFSAGGSASIVWSFDLSAGDPQMTWGNGVANLTSGALQVGGVAVPTISSTSTFTTKTISAADNVITLPKRVWFPAAGCNNATAGSIWDLPASNPAVAACVTGTNTQKGVLNFADGANLSAQLIYLLPTTWVSTIDARIKWYTSATTGDVVWQLSTICVADAETDDPAFNTASTVTDTAKGTTLQTNDAVITPVTVTGCAAGELLHLKLQRDSAHASDNLAATASVIGVELVLWETM